MVASNSTGGSSSNAAASASQGSSNFLHDTKERLKEPSLSTVPNLIIASVMYIGGYVAHVVAEGVRQQVNCYDAPAKCKCCCRRADFPSGKVSSLYLWQWSVTQRLSCITRRRFWGLYWQLTHSQIFWPSFMTTKMRTTIRYSSRHCTQSLCIPRCQTMH